MDRVRRPVLRIRRRGDLNIIDNGTDTVVVADFGQTQGKGARAGKINVQRIIRPGRVGIRQNGHRRNDGAVPIQHIGPKAIGSDRARRADHRPEGQLRRLHPIDSKTLLHDGGLTGIAIHLGHGVVRSVAHIGVFVIVRLHIRPGPVGVSATEVAVLDKGRPGPGPGATIDRVIASAAVQRISTQTTIDNIRSVAAIHRVIAGATIKRVIAIAAIDGIVAGTGVDRVIATIGVDRISATAAGNAVVARGSFVAWHDQRSPLQVTRVVSPPPRKPVITTPPVSTLRSA